MYNLKLMQLVGATKNFIQKPFLKRSVLDGFLAGLISNFILGTLIFTILYITFESNQLLTEKLLSVFSFLEIGIVFILKICLAILISLISYWCLCIFYL